MHHNVEVCFINFLEIKKTLYKQCVNLNKNRETTACAMIGNVIVGGVGGVSLTMRHFSYKIHEKSLIGWYLELQMQQLKLKSFVSIRSLNRSTKANIQNPLEFFRERIVLHGLFECSLLMFW